MSFCVVPRRRRRKSCFLKLFWDDFEWLLLHLKQLRKWFKWRSQFPHFICIRNIHIWCLRNDVDSYHQLGYGWPVTHRNHCVFHRPKTVFQQRHQIRNFLLTSHLNCQRVLLVNCTTYYYRIFEIDTGRRSIHIVLFLKLRVTF